VNAPLPLALEAEIAIPGVSLNTYVIGRCNRWGSYIRWLDYSGVFGSGPKPIRSWWGPVVLDKNVAQGWRDPRENCPVDAQEVLETDKAVRRLPEELSTLMMVEHVVRVRFRDEKGRVKHREPSQQEKADMCEISRTTYWRRCNDAYGQLLGLMNDISAGI
jgi:hypothetical protein